MDEGKPEFVPEYSKWRHGGWYVENVDYPDGGSGCVSNNYPDKKWRIACGDFYHVTFPSREAAAKAEYVATEMAKQFLAKLAETISKSVRGS